MKPILISLAALLAGILYLQWEWFPYAAPSPESDPGPAPAAEAGELKHETLGPFPPLSEFDEITARPLFIEARQPVKKETAPAPIIDTGEQSLQGLVLSAIIITPKGTVALIKDQASGESLRLEQGVNFRGWSVTSIAESELTLNRGKLTETLKLRDFSKPPAQKPQQLNAKQQRMERMREMRERMRQRAASNNTQDSSQGR